MLKLYGYPHSRSCRVCWTLEELNCDYEYIPVDLRANLAQGAPFTDITPAGKVPVLVDGDIVLSESAAICSYLADRHPDANLIPEPRSIKRAYYDQWCYFILTELEQPLWTLAKHDFVLPESLRVPSIAPTALKEFYWTLEVLSKGLGEQAYILEEQFSVADILLGNTLMWAKHAKLDLKHAHIEAYVDRLAARPALARALAKEQTQ